MIWCIAALPKEYQRRMYHLLDLYALPFRRGEPVVCVDEKSLQLLAHSRTPMPMKPGRLRKGDHEYMRRGACNLFVTVELKAGRRNVVLELKPIEEFAPVAWVVLGRIGHNYWVFIQSINPL